MESSNGAARRNTGQDLRLTPGTSVTSVDSNLNGAAPGAVSVAYTNNDTDPATGTTLFYIGPSNPNTLFNTSNPNGGVLTTVGALGVSSTQNVGFDISGLSGIAFASLTSPTGLGSSLYTIDLSTGAASLVGTIGGGQVTVRGLAASPAQASVPESGNNAVLFGLAFGGLFFVQRALASRKLAAAQKRFYLRRSGGEDQSQDTMTWSAWDRFNSFRVADFLLITQGSSCLATLG